MVRGWQWWWDIIDMTNDTTSCKCRDHDTSNLHLPYMLQATVLLSPAEGRGRALGHWWGKGGHRRGHYEHSKIQG